MHTKPRSAAPTGPIINQNGDPCPTAQQAHSTRTHRNRPRGVLPAAAAAALGFLLFSGPVTGWLQHTITVPTPEVSATSRNPAATPSGDGPTSGGALPGTGTAPGTGTTPGAGAQPGSGAGSRGGPKVSGHHPHSPTGSAQPLPGPRAAFTPP